MEEIQLVTFKLGSEEYGIDIAQIREIIKIIEITPVPRAPYFVEGLINLRGTVVPVIDLRKRFNMDPSKDTNNNRIIVVDVDSRIIGIIVDCVSEVMKLNRGNIEPVPPTISTIDSKYLEGVGKINERMLLILKLNRVLNSQELTKD